jgi:hypothetical protein
MRWKSHVRFGERTGETDQPKGWTPPPGPTPRDTVRPLIRNPSSASSWPIRVADHFLFRRQGLDLLDRPRRSRPRAVLRAEDRSCRPTATCRRQRLTYLLAHAHEIPISAATWLIRRRRQRSTRRSRPSNDNGALR